MKKVIFVAGSHKASFSSMKLAEETGKEIAKKNCILICGGLTGVMESSCKGVSEEKGTSICVIPSNDKSDANKFCSVVIPSGIGFGRNFILVNSADAVILIEGQAGTYIEALASYLQEKPIIALTGSGGISDKVKNSFLDDTKKVKILSASTPKEAVELALKKIEEKQSE
ncbi:TIGR00725 family protein [Candidatus Micrarchaeota archaeon]|nr:TIGR00725 family protein [Candidatus Micrarchaeota archaeon]MBU2476317.1 TIGR00725 family protein [Candidatus Micrarchaeota archaeon]